MKCNASSSSSSSSIALIVVVTSLSACVQSSNPDANQPASDTNVVAIDGAQAKSWKSVSVEVPADGKPYADGRTMRIHALVDELTVIVEIGDFAHSAHVIEPFGQAQVSATDGADSKTALQALSGSLTVVDGDGSPTGAVTIELKDVDLVDVCSGAHKHVDSANIHGTATNGDFTGTIGVGGFVFASEVKTGFYDPFPYVGIVDGSAFTNSHNVSFFHAGSAESCSLLNPRPNHHLYNAVIVPSEVPSGGGTIDFAHTANSFFFVSEADASGNIVRQAIATKGSFDVDGDIALTDGSVLSGTLHDLELHYLDANQSFTTDAPMTIASMQWKSIFGKPQLAN